MKEGDVLLAFIDNQKKSKTFIAKGLGIARRTLYQYFDSQYLEKETKEKVEAYFKRQIFTPEAIQASKEIFEETNLKPVAISKNRSQKTTESKTVEPDDEIENEGFKEKFYQQLEENNKLLKYQVKELTESSKKVQEHLDEVLGNQLTILSMGQALQDVVLENLFPDTHADLRKSVHNRGALLKRALGRKGNRIESDK